MPHENEQYHFFEYTGKKLRDMKCRRTVSALFADIVWASKQENLSWGGFGNNKGAPYQLVYYAQSDQCLNLLFAYWEVSYLNLLQARFQFSS